MADLDKIMTALRNAHAAGDTAGAKRLAAMAKAAQGQPPSAGMAKLSDMSRNPTVQPRERGVMDTIKDNFVGVDDGVQSVGESIGTWINRAGESATLGLVGDEANAAAYSMLPGRNYPDELARMRANERGMSTAGRLSADVIGAVAPALTGVGAAAKAATLGGAMLRGAGAGAAMGGIYGAMEGEGGANERLKSGAISAALGGAIGGAIPAVSAGVSRMFAGKAPRVTAPAVDDLKEEAGALYEIARKSGVTAAREQTGELAGRIRSIAAEEGIVTPTGRIAESFPKLKDAINMVDDFAQGTMDPRQMQSVRRTFQSAAASADASERRIGRAMLETFDKFIEPLAPEFRKANALYRRAMQGELIDTAVELAGSRAGQFSGSGFENALRTEFRALERQIIKGQLKGLPESVVKQISKVARGGSIENILRGIGKAAPTGVVSAALGGGGGFMVGNAVGGPVAGAVLGGGTMLAGGLARKGATALQSQNAAIASELARAAGGNLPNALARIPSVIERGSNALGFASLPAVLNYLSPSLQGGSRP